MSNRLSDKNLADDVVSGVFLLTNDDVSIVFRYVKRDDIKLDRQLGFRVPTDLEFPGVGCSGTATKMVAFIFDGKETCSYYEIPIQRPG